MNDIDKMEKLVDRLNELAYHYYTLDNPIATDAEYDELYDELLKLEKSTGKILKSSPTQRVGGSILKGFKKHKHINPLYSLGKAQTYEEIADWINRIEKIVEYYNKTNLEKLPKLEYIMELKFDGLTINLTYKDGYLDMASTRGNGEIGEEIFPQILTISSIPLKIPFKGTMEVQGEGLMPLSALKKYNETAKVPLKNARNAAAGALRNLDTIETKKRNLIAYFYNVGYISDESAFNSQEEIIEFLKRNRIKVYPFLKKVNTLDEVIKVLEEVETLRREIDILTDGVVIKVNDIKTREVLGYTNKFPRWALAFKFEPDEYSTILKDVQWNVGRTGKVTPTAILEPIEIGDVTVGRATLNNYDDILRKKVELNSRVIVRRSNDVIPEILGVLDGEERDTKVIEMPKYCPSCHSELFKDGVHIFCPNSMSCKPQLVNRLVHFASRDAMDITGLSEKTVKKLMENLNVTELSQIYDLDKEDLLKIPGFKEKKTNNLLNAIEKSKNTTLDRFIYAIGIPNVGIKTSTDLARKFKTLENLEKAKLEDLIKIDDIGDIVANEIIDFFNDDEIRPAIDKLLEKGIKIEEVEEIKVDNSKLEGKTIVITGTLNNYVRGDLKKLLENKGAKVTSAVSKNTDYLIVGENPGSKYEKAVSLNIDIINENEIEDLIK